MEKSYLLIANWKLNFSHNEAIAFTKECLSLSAKKNVHEHYSLVICPSFDALAPIYSLLKNSSLFLGAQSCSSQEKGNFTGEISAQSLSEIGCSFCMIGHSERRLHYHEDEKFLSGALIQILKNNLLPIFCIGENYIEYEKNNTEKILLYQLITLLNALKNEVTPPSFVCIAYEPIWSIGTNKIPSNEHLEKIFTLLQEITQTFQPSLSWKLLYGGSVDKDSLPHLLKVKKIDGFLIGRASTQLHQLESMIKHITGV